MRVLTEQQLRPQQHRPGKKRTRKPSASEWRRGQNWMVPEFLSTLSTVLLSVIAMAGVLGYVGSLGHYKVDITITNCRSITGFRRDVYHLAAKNHGFYTTTEKHDSMKYDGEQPNNLVVKIAFAKHSEAIDFVIALQGWNEVHPDIVGETEVETRFGFLRTGDIIFPRHYRAASSDSPEAPSSARSVETATTVELPADWDTKNYQNISPLKLIGGCGLQMCHIKDKRLCKHYERNDKNNFLGMSPSLHKQYDGHGPVVIPNVLITIEKIHNGQVEVATEDGGTELRTRVDLRVQFMSQEAFDGCDGVLKDGSLQIDQHDPTIWVTYVFVLDFDRFKYYVEFKAVQTSAQWAV
ncbi:unnamed protein product [Ectocarpus sp. 4 AP-2014]